MISKKIVIKDNHINVENIYVFDVEAYKNYFMCGFLNVENNDCITFELSNYINEIKEMLNFISDKSLALVGYNNSNYDEVILKFIMNNKNVSNIDIYNINNKIINKGNDKALNKENNKIIENIKKTYIKWGISIDLMRVGFGTGLSFPSLKELAIRMRHEKIQDLPYIADKNLTKDECEEIKIYNKNDLIITKKLYSLLSNKIDSRFQISNEYNMDFLCSSDSEMGDALLLQKLNKNKYDFYRYNNDDNEYGIKLDKVIPLWISYSNSLLTIFLTELKNTELKVSKNKIESFKKTLAINEELELNIGKGGIHSNDKPNIFISDANNQIIDIDITSCYPSIIINERIKPEHVDYKFIDILKQLTEERTQAKMNKNTVKSDALKITINSIYGKFGFKYSWLFDLYAMLKVTFTCQLSLLMLIDILNNYNIRIISVNTDGMTCIVSDDKKERFKDITYYWQKKTKLNLEYTYYKKYIRKSVNDYIVIKNNDEVKRKGIFVYNDISKKCDSTIISKALEHYYLYNISIEDTIKSSDTINDFIYYFKSTNQFSVYLNETKLQKTNRWYIIDSNNQLFKKDNNRKDDEDGRIINIPNGYSIMLCNDITDESIPKDLNIDYYINETKKIIKEIDDSKKNTTNYKLF